MANATENCFLGQICDHDLNVDELSNIDSSLLMSLLEDSHVEDNDDDMLRIMIQSLEPEVINQQQDLCSETYNSESSSDQDYQFSDVDPLESCCSTSPADHHHLNFEWYHDMEMAYSYPSEEITSYFNGYFTDQKIETMVELGLDQDYAQVCYGMSMMEEDDDDYIGLWQ